MNPEEKARQQIDAMLVGSGWAVQTKDKIHLSAARGVAICELAFATGTDIKPLEIVFFMRVLASIDADFVLLPEDQRNKIKGNLAEKFFGVPVLKEKADEVSQKDLFGVISTVVNNLTKGK